MVKYLVLLLTLTQVALGDPLNVCKDTPYGELKPGRFGNYDDISDAIQWAIDNQHKGSGFEPYIPAGEWVFTKQIRIPNRKVGSLEGAGRGENNTSNAGRTTTLIYKGDIDTPAILYQGNNWTISNLCLAGRMMDEIKYNKPRPKIGILATMVTNRNDPRYQAQATTQLHVDSVAFFGFDRCVQNGSNIHTSNTDLHTFKRVRFYDCNEGFVNLHSMGMEIKFDEIYTSNDVKRAIVFEAGGHVEISNANCGGGGKDQTFLTTGRGVGQSQGSFVINNFKLDASTNGDRGFQLVEMLEPAAVDFYTSNIQFSNEKYADVGGITATLKGDATFTMRDSYRPGKFICHESRYPGHFPASKQRVMRPHIYINNCRLSRGKVDIEGPHSIVLENCLDWNRWTESFSPNPQLLPEVRK